MKKLSRYIRRPSTDVRIGDVVIGGANPVAVQSMTNTDTNDTEACVAQIGRIRAAGGHIVRLTTQGNREAANLANIVPAVGDVAIVADVHFVAEVAMEAALYADKVRINPGNYRDADGESFKALLKRCDDRGVALRIGVNHGSLAPHIVEQYGDTPAGMVASAMEFLRVCKAHNFTQVVVSIKSSNVRVMVQAYRLLAEAMQGEGMAFPLHLGVTEAGNGAEGRIKSSVGIGTLLAEGIGDTIRVSLTEAPENEIPVALQLVDYFVGREAHEPIVEPKHIERYSPYEYHRRETDAVGRVGGDNVPMIYSELNAQEFAAVESGDIVLLQATNMNAPAFWRCAIIDMEHRKPVIISKKYREDSLEALQIKASADFGALFIDALADGLLIENDGAIEQKDIDELALGILQAARARFTKPEYIACPGCGRTLYDLESTLEKIKAATGHLAGLKIGVMGCIVNGPGEMADADYGYVGSGRGLVTLYKGKQVVRRNVAQHEAIEALLELIKEGGDWR